MYNGLPYYLTVNIHGPQNKKCELHGSVTCQVSGQVSGLEVPLTSSGKLIAFLQIQEFSLRN